VKFLGNLTNGGCRGYEGKAEIQILTHYIFPIRGDGGHKFFVINDALLGTYTQWLSEENCQVLALYEISVKFKMAKSLICPDIAHSYNFAGMQLKFDWTNLHEFLHDILLSIPPLQFG